MNIPFWLFLNNLLQAAGMENWMCWISEDSIAQILEFFVSWLFNIIAIIWVIKVVMNVFFRKSTKDRYPTTKRSAPTKSIRADWSGEKPASKPEKTNDNEEDILADYMESVKKNAKKQLLSIIFLVIYVLTGLLTKSIAC